MRYIVYFLVSLMATTLGAMTGIGGGIIIKPALDAIGDYGASTISVLSSVTVFTMALVSIIKQASKKGKIDLKMVVPLAIGSVLGGDIGNRLLNFIVDFFHSNNFVVVTQNICLLAIITTVFFYIEDGECRPTLGIHGIVPAFIVGVLIGIISAFLGIGGGSINVALVIYVFSYGMKTAMVCSIITILFAQASKLTSLFVSGSYSLHDLSFLPVMLFGALIGGWIGSYLNKKLSIKAVEKAFKYVQILVLLICLFNIFRNLVLWEV